MVLAHLHCGKREKWKMIDKESTCQTWLASFKYSVLQCVFVLLTNENWSKGFTNNLILLTRKSKREFIRLSHWIADGKRPVFIWFNWSGCVCESYLMTNKDFPWKAKVSLACWLTVIFNNSSPVCKIRLMCLNGFHSTVSSTSTPTCSSVNPLFYTFYRHFNLTCAFNLYTAWESNTLSTADTLL